MNEYILLFNKNAKNFTLEVNKLIKDDNFSYNHRTAIHVCVYEYKTNIYYFFVFDKKAEIGDKSIKVEISDLYPFDFIFQDKARCIPCKFICDHLGDSNTIRIAEFTGREFDIIKNPYFLAHLKAVLGKMCAAKCRFSKKEFTPNELSELDTEIPKIEKLISDEYERSVCDSFVSI